MAKTILIFSDGTGQIGGLRPDQRLSNVYKMYRAMRPGPDSPISPDEQVAFYDAGLGAGETSGLTFKRLRNVMAAAVGTGIDDNVIDCYSAIIAAYEPGDCICLFGFSRGAYTARALANVMNLCGVPTRAEDGGTVPRFGPPLRAIASEAVRKVYNHGAGSSRALFEDQREALATRFRRKYGSEGLGADGEGQGNVQPYFVGVFDTVAALGSRTATIFALLGMVFLVALTYLISTIAPWWITVAAGLLPLTAAFWFGRTVLGQIKFFLDDRALALPWWDPRRWWAAASSAHMAWWTGKNYDRFVDKEIRYLRHAIAIDEDRVKFPYVGWGSSRDLAWNHERGHADWLRPMWFAGNHSDIGGSYPEPESRLSDVALRWMVDELRSAMGNSIQIIEERLITSPDALGLQHSERQAVLDAQPNWLRAVTRSKLTWRRVPRRPHEQAPLHASVKERLAATHVPQMGEVKAYRPDSLKHHQDAAAYWSDGLR